MTFRQLMIGATVVAATASLASAQGDMTVHRMGYSGSNGNAMSFYGTNSGIAAYSIASQSCNIGNVDLVWTSGDGTTHPVISQNVYRLKDNRFEHLGQSWLKHGFCALCESGCGSGTGGGCASVLRVGCADTYGSGLNDGASGGPKFTVDPVSGNHMHPDPTPTGNATIRGRLQVPVVDVDPAQNAGAQYFIEGNYVHYVDHQNGYAHNNSTWRTVAFSAGLAMNGNGNSVNHVGESCVYGWKSADAGVVIREIENTNEGGVGIHGYYQAASRVHDNGDGTYDYIYVVNNQNSTQGAYSFSIPADDSANLTDVWFNDVDYHSGEPQDGTDWSMTQGSGAITWTCPQTYAQNPNANAINWCTAYSFGFTANAAPVAGSGTLEMFEPGVGSTLVFPLEGPGVGTGTFSTPFCLGDNTGTPCPCLNPAAPGEGCLNSSGFGAVLGHSGEASVSNDTLSLHADQAVSSVSGLFFGGTTQPGGGLGVQFGDGLLCAGGAITRLQVRPTNGSGSADSTVGISAKDGSSPGDTRYYQYWFRDPSPGICGSGFNTSHGLSLTWLP